MNEENAAPPLDFFRDLRDLLRNGLRRMPASYREKHIRHLMRRQTAGGLFADRRGQADLYYTAFALRALSALDALTPELSGVVLEQLRARRQIFAANPNPPPTAPFFNAVTAASFWDAVELCREAAKQPPTEELQAAGDETEAALHRLRRPDGGWAKTPEEGGGSTYHAFLVFCLYGRLGRPLPQAAAAASFLETMAEPEGGFRENAAVKKPGANGTAAGLTLYFLLNRKLDSFTKILPHPNLPQKERGGKTTFYEQIKIDSLPNPENQSALLAEIGSAARHIAYLMNLRGTDGGFFAATNAPWTDLLSTFSALSVLKPVLENTAPEMWTEWTTAAGKFADSLEHPSGGYLGFALDPTPDTEYAFYGLGIKALAALAAKE